MGKNSLKLTYFNKCFCPIEHILEYNNYHIISKAEHLEHFQTIIGLQKQLVKRNGYTQSPKYPSPI